MLVTAGRNVDTSTRGGVTSVEGEAGVVVGVLEVRVDPGGREGTGALESEGGGIEEVVDVKVGELHAEGLADTSSLVVGNGSVDNLEAVQLTRALAHDRVNTDGTDTMATRRAGNNDGDGVSTGSEVNTSVAVVGSVVGVMGADVVVSVIAVVTADQGSLEDELTIVINGESLTRAGQIGDAEDSRADRDKVVGLANSGASSAKVELVPATIDVELDGSASMVVVVLVVVMALLSSRAAGLAGSAAGAAVALIRRAG